MSRFSKKSILVVYDYLETLRQPHADIHKYFEKILKDFFDEVDLFYQCDYTYGNKAVEILNNIDDLRYDLIIFSSNAIIRREGDIFKILSKNKKRIENYIKSGNSIIFFHQGFSGESAEVDFLEFTGIKKFEYAKHSNSNEDIIFNVNSNIFKTPNIINKEHICNMLKLSEFPLSYFEIVLDENYSDFNSTNSLGVRDNSIILNYENNGRLVVSLYPVDWIRDDKLFQNILYYVLFGVPELVAVYNEEDLDNSYYNMLCNRIGSNQKIIKYINKDNEDDIKFFGETVRSFIFSEESLLNKYKEILLNNKLSKKIKFINIDFNKKDCKKISIEFAGTKNYSNIDTIKSIIKNLEQSNWIKKALIHDIHDLIINLYIIFKSDESYKFIYKYLIDSLGNQIANRANSWIEKNDILADPLTAINAFWILCAIGREEYIKPYNDILIKFKKNSRCSDYKYLIENLIDRTSKERSNDGKLNKNNIGYRLKINKEISFGEIIRILDNGIMNEIIGKDIVYDENLSTSFFEIIKNQINKDLDFFNYDDSNLMGINFIVKFIINLSEEQSKKLNSEILLNNIYNYLISYKKRLENKAYNINGEEYKKILLFDQQLLFLISAINLIEHKYPIDVYEIINNIEYNNSKHENYQKEINRLMEFIDKQDKKISGLSNEIREEKDKHSKEKDSLIIQSFIGGIVFNLIGVVLIVINIYFLYNAVFSKSSIVENLLSLTAFVPVTIGYMIYIIKRKLYKLNISSLIKKV